MYAYKNTSTVFDVINYIQGSDVFNSSLLYEMDAYDRARTSNYKNVFYKNRLDLVSNDLYAEKQYHNMGFLSIFNRLDPRDTGKIDIKYVSQDDLNSLIAKSVTNAIS